MNRILIPLFVVLLFLTGCASVNMASTDRDMQSKAFRIQPDRANIYIYRNEYFGAAIKVPVSINGIDLGSTGAKTYFHLSVPPGIYHLNSSAENDSKVHLNVEKGRNYFVWQEMKMGIIYGRTRLTNVDETTGRSGVSESQLLETTVKF
jgi:hypothetical protein